MAEQRDTNTGIIWEFYVATGGKWRWRASDIHNRLILAVSSQGYADKRDAEKCASRFGWKALT